MNALGLSSPLVLADTRTVPPHSLSVAFAPLLVGQTLALAGNVACAPPVPLPRLVSLVCAAYAVGLVEVFQIALTPGALRRPLPLMALGSRQARAAAAAGRRRLCRRGTGGERRAVRAAAARVQPLLGSRLFSTDLTKDSSGDEHVLLSLKRAPSLPWSLRLSGACRLTGCTGRATLTHEVHSRLTQKSCVVGSCGASLAVRRRLGGAWRTVIWSVYSTSPSGARAIASIAWSLRTEKAQNSSVKVYYVSGWAAAPLPGSLLSTVLLVSPGADSGTSLQESGSRAKISSLAQQFRSSPAARSAPRCRWGGLPRRPAGASSDTAAPEPRRCPTRRAREGRRIVDARAGEGQARRADMLTMVARGLFTMVNPRFSGPEPPYHGKSEVFGPRAPLTTARGPLLPR
jgi:hypothetical protein